MNEWPLKIITTPPLRELVNERSRPVMKKKLKLLVENLIKLELSRLEEYLIEKKLEVALTIDFYSILKKLYESQGLLLMSVLMMNLV